MKTFCLRNTNNFTLEAPGAQDIWHQALVWLPAGDLGSARFVHEGTLSSAMVAGLIAAKRVVPDIDFHIKLFPETNLEHLTASYAAAFGGTAGAAPKAPPPAAPAPALAPTPEPPAADVVTDVQPAAVDPEPTVEPSVEPLTEAPAEVPAEIVVPQSKKKR